MKTKMMRVTTWASLALLMLVMRSPTPARAATCTWTGATSTDWATASNWADCGGGVPGTTDTAVIGPATNNPIVTADATVGTVTIQNGGILTYNGGTGVTFSITTFNIQDGGKYIHNRAATTPLNTATNRNFGSNSTVEIQSFHAPTAAQPTYGNLIINNAAAVQMSGYLSTVNGTLTKQNTGEFRLATTQVVNLTIGGNLDIQGGTVIVQSASTTNTASVSVAGAASIGTGTTLRRGSGATGLWTFNLAGNWTNNDTFTPGNSTVVLNGTSAQSIGGTSATTFNNLTLNNSSGATLGNNATVNGALTLTAGDLNTGSNTLTLGSAATVAGTGDVVGNVRRAHAFTTGTNYQFNNAQTLINFNSVTNGAAPTLSVNLSKSAPSGLTTAVPRVYAVTAADISTYDATLQLGYQDSETSGMTEANLRAWRHNGTRWVLQAGGVDTANNYVSATNVTAFSDWAITDNGAPTAVTLSAFDARADASNALPFVGLGALALLALGGALVQWGKRHG